MRLVAEKGCLETCGKRLPKCKFHEIRTCSQLHLVDSRSSINPSLNDKLSLCGILTHFLINPYLALNQGFSIWGYILPPPGDVLVFLVITEVAIGTNWIEGSDTAKYPAVHLTSVYNKDLSGSKC